ncbi:unnamed protein product [Kuraishia capsulata CBS 1993]|uniref:Uncharacterized protein n=1 Tax=Kuraishia capsulata CBS 1993 TaxID=1382522 RepID=W6MQI1_9ASCO|nr:uncharacterized protein KUCA_T00003495001 [Kuraishia capsulata CBS 1993]CDK27517.1 unnamed protein product [Kuraishia capsulata CBS 1993]
MNPPKKDYQSSGFGSRSFSDVLSILSTAARGYVPGTVCDFPSRNQIGAKPDDQSQALESSGKELGKNQKQAISSAIRFFDSVRDSAREKLRSLKRFHFGSRSSALDGENTEEVFSCYRRFKSQSINLNLHQNSWRSNSSSEENNFAIGEEEYFTCNENEVYPPVLRPVKVASPQSASKSQAVQGLEKRLNPVNCLDYGVDNIITFMDDSDSDRSMFLELEDGKAQNNHTSSLSPISAAGTLNPGSAVSDKSIPFAQMNQNFDTSENPVVEELCSSISRYVPAFKEQGNDEDYEVSNNYCFVEQSENYPTRDRPSSHDIDSLKFKVNPGTIKFDKEAQLNIYDAEAALVSLAPIQDGKKLNSGRSILKTKQNSNIEQEAMQVETETRMNLEDFLTELERRELQRVGVEPYLSSIREIQLENYYNYE